jgi:cytochrome b subunit of formate dehydrogenase
MQPKSDSHQSIATESDRVMRHRLIDRLFHWITAACMLVLLATALLPIFGFKFNWLAPHWIAGLFLTAAVLLHAVRAITTLQLQHMSVGFGEMLASASTELSNLRGDHSKTVKMRKYSVAQKLFHLGMSAVVVVAIGTGLVMMIGIDTPFWERDAFFISERARGFVFVAHDIATLLSISMIIIHIYFAVRPEKLYFTRSMINGWISRSDYEKNHDPLHWQEEDG